MATIAPLESIFTIVGKSRSVILNLSRIMQFSHHHVDPISFIFEDSSFYFPYNESEWGLEIAKSTILFLQLNCMDHIYDAFVLWCFFCHLVVDKPFKSKET